MSKYCNTTKRALRQVSLLPILFDMSYEREVFIKKCKSKNQTGKITIQLLLNCQAI